MIAQTRVVGSQTDVGSGYDVGPLKCSSQKPIDLSKQVSYHISLFSTLIMADQFKASIMKELEFLVLDRLTLMLALMIPAFYLGLGYFGAKRRSPGRKWAL